ncbi:MAG TPA: hypothetical protein VK420_01875 [Longimicrobium sp.]|nr:hypothetical protein [Longimicrobium sp.]
MPTASWKPHLARGLPDLVGPPSHDKAEAVKPLNAHILVVDDEPDISALVAYHLARESYRVRTASTGPEAIRAA